MSYSIDENCISCGKCEKQCLDDAIYIGDDQFYNRFIKNVLTADYAWDIALLMQ